MKRKATRLLAMVMSTLLVTSLAACGDGSDENANEVLTPVEAEPMLSDLELEIVNLETEYNKGEFTQADYLALADAYSRAGYIRRQRDMLEQDYRLYGDAEAFASLQGLCVNLEEETEEIRSRAQEMRNNLELTDYVDESINLIDSADWFTTMMPKLKEGQRSYYLEQDGQTLFYAQVGYTEEGQCFSKVWYMGDQAKRFLSQEETTIRLVTVTPVGTGDGATETPDTMETDTADPATEIPDTTAPMTDAPETMDQWNGMFEAWSVDSATGSVTHEQGTLQNGILTGDYTCNIHPGEGTLDVYSLWSNREGMEYATYTGSFDAEGKSLTEQPSEEMKKKLLEGTGYKDLILYAYDATGENCLWQGIGEDASAADYSFGGEMIGLETRPEYTSYEVTADMTTGHDTTGNTDTANAGNTTGSSDAAGSATPQIRIFDGEIQWFDGKYWVSAGNVKEMEKQDPFVAYEENHGGTDSGNMTGSITGGVNGNTSDGNGGQNVTGGTGTGDKNSGSIQKPAVTASPSPTTKPAATAKPAATPAPTPAPTPEPVQNNDDDDDDSGSSNDNNSSDSGSSDSGSSDSGSSDNGSSDSGSSDSGSSDNGSSDSGDSGNSGGDSGGNDVDVDWTPDLL